MKAIMVMYDSLNRKLLEPYGCQWIKTPNFTRLAQKAVTFDNCYAGSLPCMPARRELHTGRYNFFHRSWGPMEPFDDSMPEFLKKSGVYTHLVSDHAHYWEDGGSTYHTRYNSWEAVRGQEGDPWQTAPDWIEWSSSYYKEKSGTMFLNEDLHMQDEVNRRFMQDEAKMPQSKTFAAGLEFIERNHHADNWFLQIETFDPHEPFFCGEAYKKLYPEDECPDAGDWPPYFFVREDEKLIRHYKNAYARMIAMCDNNLGKVLDAMDKYGLWEDTMLIINTDHGFMLGEHNWWAKSMMPVYDEIVHTPLFIYMPGVQCGKMRKSQLVQTIDIPATLLAHFGAELPEDMQGRPLQRMIRHNEPVRETAAFGFFGGYMNITDGRYVYMCAPLARSDEQLFEYTLMPAHMRSMFSAKELQKAVLSEGFDFTKGCPVLKVPAVRRSTEAANIGTRLFDLLADPQQTHPIDDPEQEARMAQKLLEIMEASGCPPEQYGRIGLKIGQRVMADDILRLRTEAAKKKQPDSARGYLWEEAAKNMYWCILSYMEEEKDDAKEKLEQLVERLEKTGRLNDRTVTADIMMQWIEAAVDDKRQEKVKYYALLNSKADE